MTTYTEGDFQGSKISEHITCAYAAGDFTFIKDSHSKAMLEDAYNTITELALWDWMKSYTPEEGKGFMFSTHENITKLGSAMKTAHSGASYGWTMRNMEAIAKNGWEAFVESWKKE